MGKHRKPTSKKISFIGTTAGGFAALLIISGIFAAAQIGGAAEQPVNKPPVHAEVQTHTVVPSVIEQQSVVAQPTSPTRVQQPAQPSEQVPAPLVPPPPVPPLEANVGPDVNVSVPPIDTEIGVDTDVHVQVSLDVVGDTAHKIVDPILGLLE